MLHISEQAEHNDEAFFSHLKVATILSFLFYFNYMSCKDTTLHFSPGVPEWSPAASVPSRMTENVLADAVQQTQTHCLRGWMCVSGWGMLQNEGLLSTFSNWGFLTINRGCNGWNGLVVGNWPFGKPSYFQRLLTNHTLASALWQTSSHCQYTEAVCPRCMQVRCSIS